MAGFSRSPTFLVGGEKQKENLATLQKRDEHYSTEYAAKGKPLCFQAEAYQKPHPAKLKMGYKDADATLTSPMLLGVCDGVSQLEEYGMDPSELPHELLNACQELAMSQLMPEGPTNPADQYRGPISLLTEAYEATEALGSTTVLLAALDNSTKIHGKLHPMVAVLSIGDCELLMLRRTNGRQSDLEAVFHTEMQRIDGHVQTPLQLARVDERIDEDFDEEIALEVIRKGSAVHCVSAYEGDILVLGSDGVFDNLFLDEVCEIANQHLSISGSYGSNYAPVSQSALKQVAKAIVAKAHSKSTDDPGIAPDTPIGKGGKVDDTSCVVAEVVEWTKAHGEYWKEARGKRQWHNMLTCGGATGACGSPCGVVGAVDDEEEDFQHTRTRGVRIGNDNYTDVSDEEEEEDDHRMCSIQ